VPRSPARAAVKIRCRSRRTLSSGERQSMASHTKTSFAGPFTVRCPTCPPIPTELTSIRFTAHLPTSAPLSGPGHHGSVSGQLPSNGHLEEQPHRCGFLSAFAHRHSLLGHPVPARRIPPSLTVGLPHRHSGPDSVGVPAFRTCEKRPGWVPSLLRGGGVVPATETSMTGACRFTTASPLPPLQHPIGEGWDHEAYEDSPIFTRPVFPSPVVPGWNGDPSASSPGFAPHGHP
jgi:hypothetical protein